MFEDDKPHSDGKQPDPHQPGDQGGQADGYEGSSFDLDQVPTQALLAVITSRFSVSNLEKLDSAGLVQAVVDVEEAGRCIDLLRVNAAGEIDARGSAQLLEDKKKDSGLGIAGWENPVKTEAKKDKPDTSAGAGSSVSATDLHGCRNTNELLQRITAMSRANVSKRVKLARAIRTGKSLTGELMPAKFAAVAAGLDAGVLAEDTALMIVEKLSKLPAHIAAEDIQAAEESLVALAAGTRAPNDLPEGEEDSISFIELLKTPVGLPEHTDRVKIVADLWVNVLDQDGKEPADQERVESRRYFNIGKERNGLVPINALVLPVIASSLGQFMTGFNSPRVKTDKPVEATADQTAVGDGQTGTDQTAAGDGTAGADSPDTDAEQDGKKKSKVRFEAINQAGTGADADVGVQDVDTRSQGQKNHDALAVMVQILGNSKDTPTLGGAPITLLIEVRQEDLDRHQQGEPGGFGLMHTHDGEVAPISLGDVMHAGCAGTVQRITRDSAGRVVGLGSPARVFNANQRKAITLRDRGCVIPGCTVPAAWCEIHHVIEYSKGGPTHIDNGVMLCWYHHRNIDRNGWQVKMISGVPYVRPPKWLQDEPKWIKTCRQGEIPKLKRRRE